MWHKHAVIRPFRTADNLNMEYNDSPPAKPRISRLARVAMLLSLIANPLVTEHVLLPVVPGTRVKPEYAPFVPTLAALLMALVALVRILPRESRLRGGWMALLAILFSLFFSAAATVPAATVPAAPRPHDPMYWSDL